MRIFLSVAFLLGGVGLCLLNAFAHAFVNANSASGSCYYKHIGSVPYKNAYSRAEITDSMWQVWTNRMSLPAQSTYSAEELKRALLESAHVVGSAQDSSDCRGLDIA